MHPRDDLVFRQRCADDVRAAELLPVELQVLEEPAIVEERELTGEAERFPYRAEREGRPSPKRPPVFERDPVDEDFRRHAGLGGRRIDVASRERIAYRKT